jgi:UDP-N-acetylmuramoylalanine--D-glutamate ligase
MARRRWPATRAGGNLGRSLLPEVESIAPGEWVVLELSSFQLEDLAAIDRRPEVSVVTNLSPNHLDRHGTYEAYVEAKRQIVRRGPPPNVAVLNGEDPLVRSWAAEPRAALFFGRTGTVTPRAPGVWLDEARGEVALSRGSERTSLFAATALRLPGRFNLLNAAAAAAAASAMGVAPAEIAAAVADFQAVEHRLEPVAEVDGVAYLNDSIATTPESTIAAIEALGPRLIIICGGSRKGCSFSTLGRLLARRTRGAVLLGETAAAIRAAIPERPGGAPVRMARDLEEAVAMAREMARPGDRVILSPACPSFDMFVNFEDRGRRFKEIARRLAGA